MLLRNALLVLAGVLLTACGTDQTPPPTRAATTTTSDWNDEWNELRNDVSEAAYFVKLKRGGAITYIPADSTQEHTDLLAYGRAVCTNLDNGGSVPSLLADAYAFAGAHHIEQDRQHWELAWALYTAVRVAIEELCDEHTDRLQDGSYGPPDFPPDF